MCYLLIATWDWRKREGAKHAGVRIAIVMPTLLQARKVHQALLIAELEGDGEWAFLGAKINRTDLRIDFPGGSWIHFISAEAAQNARGIRCDVVAADEADDVDMSIVDAITIPWFSEPHSLRITIVSGTPKRGRYGLLYRTHARGMGKALDVDGVPFTDHHSFHATAFDFPQFVDPKAIEKARRETAPSIFAREWLCDFDAAEGLVYPMFDERFHVRSPPAGLPWSEILVGADWGWNDPGCYLVIAVAGSGADAIAWILYEVYESEREEDWWLSEAAKILEWYPTAKWHADPSRPDRIASLKTKVGVKVCETDNAIDAGVDCVANLLSVHENEREERSARLYVDPRCTNTIREFGTYRRKRDPRNTERVLDDIEDKNNHACDALRYALYARFRSLPMRREKQTIKRLRP